MADRWFYSHEQAKIGPCSGQQLRDLAACGRLLPTDTIWKEGVEKGVPASRVKNLFAPPASVAAPVAKAGAIADIPEVAPPQTPPATERHASPTAAETEAAPAAREAGPRPEAERPAAASSRHGASQPARTGRATAGKGAIVVSQDGVNVKYRKKCTTCGHLDPAWNTTPIRNGVTRSGYYCPKCRKHREVEVHGSLH